MVEISISSTSAAGHPRFMAGCAERGHRVEVIESGQQARETAAPARSAAIAAQAAIGARQPAPRRRYP